MMIKDNGILKDIMKLQAYTIMIIMPTRLVFHTSTEFVHPLNEVIGKWFCSAYWFIEKISFQMIASHSLAVALLRYAFILYDEKVMEFGKEKLKDLVWYLSIGVPIFTLLWISTDLKELDVSTSINRCNGMDHKMFLVQSWSSLGYIKKSFVKVENFEKGDGFEKALAIMRKISKIAQRIWQILLVSNLGEGIIYYKLFKHTKRYDIIELTNRCYLFLALSTYSY